MSHLTSVLMLNLFIFTNFLPGDFRCQDSQGCVSRSLVCDGLAHCHDSSDEVNCPSLPAPASRANVLMCSLGSRSCNNGRECVSYKHVCDGENDCMDGSDEQGCPETCRKG